MQTAFIGAKYSQQFQKNLAQRSNQNVKIARIIHDLNSKAARPLKWNQMGKKLN